LAVIVFSTVYLIHYYGETRPTAAQEQAGRNHAVKIHDRTVYLTAGEYALAFTTHAITIVAIGVFLGIVIKSGRAKR
jgi:hypothetical protein